LLAVTALLIIENEKMVVGPDGVTAMTEIPHDSLGGAWIYSLIGTRQEAGLKRRSLELMEPG
jgi:hypothetical protein